jgi:hypothetical protein
VFWVPQGDITASLTKELILRCLGSRAYRRVSDKMMLRLSEKLIMPRKIVYSNENKRGNQVTIKTFPAGTAKRSKLGQAALPAPFRDDIPSRFFRKT